MSISEMLDSIKIDMELQGSYDRYPVRFFSMKYAKDTATSIMRLRSEIEKMSGFSVEIIDIKDFLPHEDGWITVDNFRNHIYELDFSRSYIIVGFSEYARFLSNAEFITMILGLLEAENTDINYRRRIYIPCFALFSQIQKIVKERHRRMDVYNPFLNDVNAEDLPIIYFVNEALNLEKYENEINNSSEWFGLWRNPEISVDKPIMCTSKMLLYFYEKAFPDNVYNIQSIKTYEELLKCLYGVESFVAAKSDSDQYYQKLINLLGNSRQNSLKNVILQSVNAHKITYDNVYLLWKNADEFGRWLIQNYILQYEKTLVYLGIVMKSLNSLSEKEFVEMVYTCIIYQEDKKSMIKERQKLISSIGRVGAIQFNDRMKNYCQNYMKSIFKGKTAEDVENINFDKDIFIQEEYIAKLSDVVGQEIVPLLTDCSAYERQMVIWFFREGIVSNDRLKRVYPNLEYYFASIDDLDIGKDGCRFDYKRYFDLYRKARVIKDKASDYDRELMLWNKDEDMFYTWYTDSQLKYPEIILKQQGFGGNTYVLDGVGAEFMEYIVNTLRHKNIDIKFCTYAKAHLPSITSVAKESYQMKYVLMTDYDQKVVHGQIYYPVKNIESALTTIEKMIDVILGEEGDSEFAITADHGATAGHKIFKKGKKYEFIGSDHDGRCYKLPSDQHEDGTSDYLCYIDEKNREWLIALNEQSLHNNSKYMVHGGATPEEVLIPVIIAAKAKKQSRKYKVEAVNLKVSGLEKTVLFKVNPKPEKVRLQAKDSTDIWMKYDLQSRVWMGEIKRGIEQDIRVTVENQEFGFRTIPSTKMGDDLFDD